MTKKSNPIYTVTTVSLSDNNIRSRCWGWYSSRRKAISVAKTHAEFFSECGYYTHIVIEKCKEGLISYDLKPTWLELKILPDQVEKKWITSEGTESFTLEDTYEAVEIDAPDSTKSTVGWGIG